MIRVQVVWLLLRLQVKHFDWEKNLHVFSFLFDFLSLKSDQNNLDVFHNFPATDTVKEDRCGHEKKKS